MALNIGSVIRKLRTVRGITQETLAERLGVMPQTVSKWERREGYPDITQLLPLATFFGVTLDELMGRDRDKEESEIESILNEYDRLWHLGDHSTGEDLMIDAYAAHPGDFRIMSKYIDALTGCPSVLAYREEIEKTAAYLLDNCTDDGLRTETLVNLAIARNLFSDFAGALEAADRLPPMRACREVVRLNGSDFTEANNQSLYHKELIEAAAENVLWALYVTACQSENAGRMLEDILTIADIIWPDFDCGSCHSELSYICASLFEHYAKSGEKMSALRIMERGFRHARTLDQTIDKVIVHTSPFLCGIKDDMKKTWSDNKSNYVCFYLEELLSDDVIAPDPDYSAMVEKYRPFASEDVTKT